MQNEPIEKVELYYIDENDDKNIVITVNDDSLYFYEYNGYNEYFNFKSIDKYLDNFYLEIKTDSKDENMHLSIDLDYINKNFFAEKNKNISEDKPVNKEIEYIRDYELENKLKANLEYKNQDNNEYYYKIIDKKKKRIEYIYQLLTNTLHITIYNDEKIEEQFIYDLNTKEIDYRSYINDVYNFSYLDEYNCLYGDCGKESNMKEKVADFNKYISFILEK